MNEVQNVVDCRGMMCPAPILRVAEAARNGTAESLTIFATDPDFVADIEAWCRSASANLIEVQKLGDGSIRAKVALSQAKPKAANAPGVLSLVGLEPRAAMRKLQERHLQGDGFELIADRSINANLHAWASAMSADLDVIPQTDTLTIRMRVSSAPAEPVHALLPIERNHIVANLESRVSSQTDLPPVLQSAAPQALSANLPPRENQTTLLVLKNDYESLLSALMVANASAAQGMKVKVFFAFWAINMLRAHTPRKGSKRIAGFFQTMLKMLMPRGMSDQRLGKLNMGGLGKTIFLWIMKGKNIMNLEQLVDQAVKQDIEFVVCSMSMGMMGVDEGEIVSLPNIRFAGVTSFASEARQSCTSLVF
jgi:peroxiredoxin family protein/TusA-related sulfurtransferase